MCDGDKVGIDTENSGGLLTHRYHRLTTERERGREGGGREMGVWMEERRARGKGGREESSRERRSLSKTGRTTEGQREG